MKVYVTKWAVSGRVEFVDLEPTEDGKYYHGNSGGNNYFVSKFDCHRTAQEAKKRIVEKFRARRDSLKWQLENLTPTELSVIEAVDTLNPIHESLERNSR